MHCKAPKFTRGPAAQGHCSVIPQRLLANKGTLATSPWPSSSAGTAWHGSHLAKQLLSGHGHALRYLSALAQPPQSHAVVM